MKQKIQLLALLLLATRVEAQTAGASVPKESNHSITVDEVKYSVCSTERINRNDCVVVVDRLYPVTWPTIQMSGSNKVFVALKNPMQFETVSLDLTGFSALPGTDQIFRVGNRAAGHGDPREPLGPEYIPTPALSPRQACDDTRSCGSQPAYGSLSDCR